jgi:hypothetical protein
LVVCGRGVGGRVIAFRRQLLELGRGLFIPVLTRDLLRALQNCRDRQLATFNTTHHYGRQRRKADIAGLRREMAWSRVTISDIHGSRRTLKRNRRDHLVAPEFITDKANDQKFTVHRKFGP